MANPFLRVIGFGLVSIALAGCGSEGGGTDDGDDNGTDPEVLPTYPDGTGQAPYANLAYPAGPFGVSKGSIIANFQFIGMPNSTQSTELRLLQLAEFYNPSGAEVFPADHPYFPGQAKPKALLINIGSTWCPPCNYEADVTLPPLYAQYKPMGGEFLFQLADGPTPGKPATVKNLENWTGKYDLDYPAVLDPSYKLSALFESDAFPANMIVDTKTMTLVQVVSGGPEAGSSFWKQYEALLE